MSNLLTKQVEITKVTTMADGTIRLYIDLLDSREEDIKTAYALRAVPTSMILTETENIASEGDNPGMVESPDEES